PFYTSHKLKMDFLQAYSNLSIHIELSSYRGGLLLPQLELQNKAPAASVWWRLMRPHTLTASFVPVLVGTAMAIFDGQLDIPLFLAMLIASIMIQAATNMLNEYFDYVRGLDNEESVGIGGTIVRDGIAPRTVRNLAIIFYAISVAIGVYICMESSWWVA